MRRQADLGELASDVAAGATTYAGIAAEYLERIRRDDPALHAFVEVYEESALAQARARDVARRAAAARGILFGMPLAAKDLLDVRGRAASAGSRARGASVASATAEVLMRLEDAGMTLLGKTHTVEYAFGGWGINKWMGTPRNPWDAAVHRIPGGSSSGSAAAVAAGLAPCALGTDTGGSVRIPAALNGIVGFKPTRELVSTRGCFALSATLDSVGPMTLSVADAEAMFLAMLEPARALSLAGASTGQERAVAVPVDDVEAVSGLDADVRQHYGRCEQRLQSMGVATERVRMPFVLSELMSQSGELVAYDAWHQHRSYIKDDSLPFDPHVRARVLAGERISDARYRELQAAHIRASETFSRWMERYSAVLLPTVPWPAPPVAEVDPAGADITVFTRIANFAHGCAISVPVGLASSGMPVGMQLMGAPFTDRSILALAGRLEKNTGFRQRYSPPRP